MWQNFENILLTFRASSCDDVRSAWCLVFPIQFFRRKGCGICKFYHVSNYHMFRFFFENALFQEREDAIEEKEMSTSIGRMFNCNQWRAANKFRCDITWSINIIHIRRVHFKRGFNNINTVENECFKERKTVSRIEFQATRGCCWRKCFGNFMGFKK